jgi:hypothetical protein
MDFKNKKFIVNFFRLLPRILTQTQKVINVDFDQFENYGSKTIENIPLGIKKLKSRYSWPQLRPNVKVDPHGWFSDKIKVNALKALLNPSTKVIIELGSWLGMSTRIMLNAAPNATLIAVDHWKGSLEHQDDPVYKNKISTLYEVFLANCWNFKERLIPVKENTINGLQIIYDFGVKPDLILIDAEHSYSAVLRDITKSKELFPSAILVGDDFLWNEDKEQNFPVKRAVKFYAKQHQLEIEIHGNLWRLI